MRIGQADLSGKKLTIEVVAQHTNESTPVLASGNELLCFSLLNNLLKNACEAAPEKSRVRLTLIPAEHIELVMENQPAVPVAFRSRFFENTQAMANLAVRGLVPTQRNYWLKPRKEAWSWRLMTKRI